MATYVCSPITTLLWALIGAPEMLEPKNLLLGTAARSVDGSALTYVFWAICIITHQLVSPGRYICGIPRTQSDWRMSPTHLEARCCTWGLVYIVAMVGERDQATIGQPFSLNLP